MSSDATVDQRPVVLVYVGPPGQESPTFGPLEPGQRYQCADRVLAEYLVTQHPTHWSRVLKVAPLPRQE